MSIAGVRGGRAVSLWVGPPTGRGTSPWSLPVAELPSSTPVTLRSVEPGAAWLEGLGDRVAVSVPRRDLLLVEELDRAAEATLMFVVERDGDRYLLEGRQFAEAARLPAIEIVLSSELVGAIPQGQRVDPIGWFLRTFQLFPGAWSAFVGRGQVKVGAGLDLLGRGWRCTITSSADSGRQRNIASGVRRQNDDVLGAILLRADIRAVPFHAEAVGLGGAPAHGPEPTTKQGFLRFWTDYNTLEQRLGELLAVQIGEIPYVSRRFDGTTFVFDLHGELPAALDDRELRVSFASIDEEKDHGTEPTPVGELVRATPRTVSIKPSEHALPPPERGRLVLDRRGEAKRLRDRERALERVEGHAGRRPDLLEILDGRATASPRPTRRGALSPTVLERLAGRTLTDAQRRAVEIAINTPDFAVIQGPPGTGKTTVIHMIAQRLSELGEKYIRFTAFQQDAVDRMTDGAEIGGLPVPRVGGRAGEGEEAALSALQDWFDKIRPELLSRAERLPAPLEGRADQLAARLADYGRSSRSHADVRDLIRVSLEIAGHEAPPELKARLNGIDARLRTLNEAVSQGRELEELLAAQRTSSGAFADDGPIQARRLLRALPQDVRVEERLILREAASREPIAGPPSGYEELIRSLRARFATTSERAALEGARDEAEKVAREALDFLEEESARGESGVRQAILRFCEESDEEPESFRDGLARYAPVLAVSTGQSANTFLPGLEDEFETVIVDEAARANPLDLLIPLVRAARIIVVGDELQLPHIVEEEILRQVEENIVDVEAKAEVRRLLEESTFGRLVRAYEKSPPGGIQRVQLLDVQFRSHPTIARFVSEEFYGGRLRTPEGFDRPNDTGLWEGSPVGWISVRGRPEQGRYSREAEVSVLVREVAHALATAPPATTVGVITFYRQQADLLRDAIAAVADSERRVRIGTVDAFQGREFDVVYVSCVRANREKRVGFLNLTNRICVALSRARKLLVVAGDPLTVGVVPALAHFQELCRKHGRVRVESR